LYFVLVLFIYKHDFVVVIVDPVPGSRSISKAPLPQEMDALSKSNAPAPKKLMTTSRAATPASTPGLMGSFCSATGI
jgi:hypothetical protein